VSICSTGVLIWGVVTTCDMLCCFAGVGSRLMLHAPIAPSNQMIADTQIMICRNLTGGCLFMLFVRYLTSGPPYGNGHNFPRKNLEHGFHPLMVFCSSHVFSRTPWFSISPCSLRHLHKKRQGPDFSTPVSGSVMEWKFIQRLESTPDQIRSLLAHLSSCSIELKASECE
jgi:hypothetical protein